MSFTTNTLMILVSLYLIAPKIAERSIWRIKKESIFICTCLKTTLIKASMFLAANSPVSSAEFYAILKTKLTVNCSEPSK